MPRKTFTVVTDAIGNDVPKADESVRRSSERRVGLHGYIDVNIRLGVIFGRGCDECVGPGYRCILGCSATATNTKCLIQAVTTGKKQDKSNEDALHQTPITYSGFIRITLMLQFTRSQVPAHFACARPAGLFPNR